MKRQTLATPSGRELHVDVHEQGDEGELCTFCPVPDEDALAKVTEMAASASGAGLCLNCVRRLRRLALSTRKQRRNTP